jgi:hypothetical protein
MKIIHPASDPRLHFKSDIVKNTETESVFLQKDIRNLCCIYKLLFSGHERRVTKSLYSAGAG